MTSNSLKATTAILAALSLMQPLPALTQSSTGASDGVNGAMTGQSNRIDPANIRTFEKICADAMISSAIACELHVQDLLAAAEIEAEVAVDAAAQFATEAEAAAQFAIEVEAAGQAAADAEAAELARAATKAEGQAAEAAGVAAWLDAEAEAAAQAADADAQADADASAQAAGEAADETDTATTEQEDGASTETTASSASIAEDCLDEVVDSDGTIPCVQALNPESVDAIASEEADVQAESQAEVTTQTITEGTSRSSDEEFNEWSPDDEQDEERLSASDSDEPAEMKRDSGLSDLEKAGLVALGAVAVGAILYNGQRVEANTGDRVIVVDDEGAYQVMKDDDALLRQPGSDVRTERFSDGSVRTTVTRDDGTRIITIRDSTGRALHRLRIDPDGREYVLIDDTRAVEPVIVEDLPEPNYDNIDYRAASERDGLRRALLAADRRDLGRRFSLRQVREYAGVRELAPEINLEAITFTTNSAALEPSQAERLRKMGQLMRELIAEDPTELFLIEGHTDAVGDRGHNLLLSDRRAESVALAYSEYFGVPAENMVVQGYGESYLKIATGEAERLNRRVAVRRITALVR